MEFDPWTPQGVVCGRHPYQTGGTLPDPKWKQRSWRRSSLSTHTRTLCSPPASSPAPPVRALAESHHKLSSNDRVRFCPLPNQPYLPSRETGMGCSYPVERRPQPQKLSPSKKMPMEGKSVEVPRSESTPLMLGPWPLAPLLPTITYPNPCAGLGLPKSGATAPGLNLQWSGWQWQNRGQPMPGAIGRRAGRKSFASECFLSSTDSHHFRGSTAGLHDGGRKWLFSEDGAVLQAGGHHPASLHGPILQPGQSSVSVRPPSDSRHSPYMRTAGSPSYKTQPMREAIAAPSYDSSDMC